MAGPAETPPNVARMYVYSLLAECLLVVPILIPLYVSQGLDATDVFLVQGVFTIGVFVFEVPSGYFADVLGRRLSLVLAAAFWVLGFTGYSLARSFAGFAVAELLLAFGASMRSGTDAALVFDSLREVGGDEEYARYQGRVELASRVGTAAASIAGGLLGAAMLALPVYANVATALLMLAVALGFAEPRRAKPPYANPLKGIGAVVRSSISDRRLLVPMLLLGVMTSVGIIGIWSYLLLFQRSGVGPVATGVVFAVFQLASGLGSHQAARLERALGRRRTWAIFPLVGVGLLAIGLFPRVPVCAAVMLLNAVVWGISGPLLMARINERTGSETRATVISVGNMLGRIFYAVLAPAIGHVADAASLPLAFVALGTPALLATAGLLAASGMPRERAGASARSGG